jgi:hypothetical protein
VVTTSDVLASIITIESSRELIGEVPCMKAMK